MGKLYLKRRRRDDRTEFTVITENDESAWDDETGEKYHFPKRYAKFLRPGTRVVYYKGKQRKDSYSDTRLTDAPHYFAAASIGRVWVDENSKKGDMYAEIVHYRPFREAVLAKVGETYIETIPTRRVTNYWRDGVRSIDAAIYQQIVSRAAFEDDARTVNDDLQGDRRALESAVEGRPTERFVTRYERVRELRNRAIELHGTVCTVCGFDFGDVYGDIGAGFTHIHHLKPVSTLRGPTTVVAETDLRPVCANCHSMIHRRPKKTLSIEELRAAVLLQRGRRA